jgi:hypothetical protein
MGVFTSGGWFWLFSFGLGTLLVGKASSLSLLFPKNKT